MRLPKGGSGFDCALGKRSRSRAVRFRSLEGSSSILRVCSCGASRGGRRLGCLVGLECLQLRFRPSRTCSMLI